MSVKSRIFVHQSGEYGFSKKAFHRQYFFLFPYVLLTFYNHLREKLGMYFALCIFFDFCQVCKKVFSEGRKYWLRIRIRELHSALIGLLLHYYNRSKVHENWPSFKVWLMHQRYTYRVLQTIQMKLILLCVLAEQAVLGSAKTDLEF